MWKTYKKKAGRPAGKTTEGTDRGQERRAKRSAFSLTDALESGARRAESWSLDVRGSGHTAWLLSAVLSLVEGIATTVTGRRPLGLVLEFFKGLGGGKSRESFEAVAMESRLNAVAMYLLGAAKTQAEYEGWWVDIGRAIQQRFSAVYGLTEVRAFAQGALNAAADLRVQSAQTALVAPLAAQQAPQLDAADVAGVGGSAAGAPGFAQQLKDQFSTPVGKAILDVVPFGNAAVDGATVLGIVK